MSKVCLTSHLTLGNLNKVKYYMDTGIKKILAQARVMSKVDYCNRLLHWSVSENQRLQYTQNMCAQFVIWLYFSIFELTALGQNSVQSRI